jgi:hypothetical protein
MPKYLLAYTNDPANPGPSAEDMMGATPEQQQAMIAAWGAWYGALGDKVVDPGNPTGPSVTLSASGRSDGASSGITGYSIISADNLDQAAELAKGNPILADGGVIHIYETFDVM